MITIHLLRHPSEEIPKGSLALQNQGQYPTVRKQICDALEQKQDIDVYILTRVCDDWFWDLSDYHHDVLVINDAPTERLKRKLSVDSLPLDLAKKPELILELGLLDLSNPTEGITDIWRWIIQHKLGQLWTTEEPTQHHFSQLVNWYTENTVNPLLQSKVDNLAKSWLKLAPGKLKSAYARFFENPVKNAHLLIITRALFVYDHKLREQWLAAEGWYSPKMEDIIDLIEPPNILPIAIRRKLNPKLRTHWNTRLKDI